MSKLSPTPQERPGGPAAFQTGADGMVPDADPDFADEHSDTTYADDLDGGPEGSRDPDSPSGRAGMDPA